MNACYVGQGGRNKYSFGALSSMLWDQELRQQSTNLKKEDREDSNKWQMGRINGTFAVKSGYSFLIRNKD